MPIDDAIHDRLAETRWDETGPLHAHDHGVRLSTESTPCAASADC